MTPKQDKRLANLAGAIALEAPLRNSGGRATTYVSWELVNNIRAILEEAGIDWRAKAKRVRAEHDRIRTEATRAYMAEQAALNPERDAAAARLAKEHHDRMPKFGHKG